MIDKYTNENVGEFFFEFDEQDKAWLRALNNKWFDKHTVPEARRQTLWHEFHYWDASFYSPVERLHAIADLIDRVMTALQCLLPMPLSLLHYASQPSTLLH